MNESRELKNAEQLEELLLLTEEIQEELEQKDQLIVELKTQLNESLILNEKLNKENRAGNIQALKNDLKLADRALRNEKEKLRSANVMIGEYQNKIRCLTQQRDYARTHQKIVEIPVEKPVLYEKCESCDRTAYQNEKAKYGTQKERLAGQYKAKTVMFQTTLFLLAWYSLTTTLFQAVQSDVFLSDCKSFFHDAASFLQTFRFIHVHTWIIQLFIFLSGITMALNFKNLQPISEIMLCITGVIFISALFFLDELFKSFTTGMWELEQTFKYDLRQHIMMKLLIFGIIDMVIVILLSLMTKSIVSLPLYQILVYVLVPYNIVCIILFSLITIWRKQLHNYFLWCISGSICVAVILIANIFKIYEIRMLYWGIAYFITTTILGIILYSQTKIIKWEVASVWN
jgi:hypothetical protein